MEAMQPEFEDEEAINPFDFWGGANFKLKLKKVAGYWNYDSSEFAAAGPLLQDDDAMEAIWKKQYSLAELVAADKFKSYEDLEKRLNMVLGKKSLRKNFVARKNLTNLSVLLLLLLRNQLWMNLSSLIVRARLLDASVHEE